MQKNLTNAILMPYFPQVYHLVKDQAFLSFVFFCLSQIFSYSFKDNFLVRPMILVAGHGKGVL